MNYCNPNHPFVVWASCFLWLVSIFAITWSLMLFFCVGDILFISGTDMVNAVVLLSGIIMLPTNLHTLSSIAYGKRIEHKSKVVCCPMWLCIIWIMAINCLGAALCIYKICTCHDMTRLHIISTMKHYRSVSKYKHVIDNLQWSLKCCGYNSYKDWFNYDWYDKMRDYEWEPSLNKRHTSSQAIKTVTDSVPLSCCKSGSCISNYLLELGTSSIHTRGCGDLIYHIVLYSMIIHLVMFISVIAVEGLILNLITPGGLRNVSADTTTQCDATFIKQSDKGARSRGSLTMFKVKQIMPMKDNYSASSASLQLNPDDSDEFDRAEQLSLAPRHIGHVRMENSMVDRDMKKIDDECPESPEQVRKWSNH